MTTGGSRTVSLRLRLLAALAYVLLLAIVALGVPLAINLRARVSAEVKTQAQAQADLVAATAADMLGPGEHRELTILASTAAASVRGRILIVSHAGGVLVDSAGPAQVGSSYESRPEIQAALSGRQVQVQRSSKTLGQEILATAVPIVRDGHAAGAVRVTQSVAAVNSAVQRVVLGLGLLGFVVLLLGLLAGGIIAAQVGRPIKRLEQVARRVAGGDLLARAPVEGSSEQRSLATSFNDMTQRVAALLRAQREFVADASHQLRTPLTGLRLRLEEAKALGTASSAKEIDTAIAEVDRLSHTVDDLLVLSSDGKRQPTGETVDLDDLGRSAVARWRTAAAERSIALDWAPDAAAGCVWASAADLERLVDALLENAIRYSQPQTTIIVARRPGTIEIRDRGLGISDEERELVFRRFHRGAAGRSSAPGSGLGLAIARELARQFGGDVTVAPRRGGGTVATLSLPQSGVRRSELDDRFATA